MKTKTKLPIIKLNASLCVQIGPRGEVRHEDGFLLEIHHRPQTDPCPNCGKPLNAHADPTDQRPPEPGDLAICLGCIQAAVFTADLTLRPLTFHDVANFTSGTRAMLELMQFKARKARDKAQGLKI